MDRGADAAWIAEIMKSSSAPALLVEVHFDDGVIRGTNAWSPIVWQGNTYLANGHFLEIEGISESLDMTIPTVTINVSGVDQSWIAILLAKEYIDRKVLIYKAFVNYSAGVLIGTPVIIFDGRMDNISLADDPANASCVISIAVSSHFVDFRRTPGRRTNHNDQQIYYPGDNGFKLVTNINRGVMWGA
ncbi:MAG: hypothetical protein HQL80_03545 [Magnetococcales bacterium]|nr:hypothetical protein [Magnetococcales bacterium]